MAGRVIVQGGEDLVPACLIEWARFITMRLQGRAYTAAFDRVFLCGLEQPAAVSLSAHGRGDPEMRDMQPAAPDIAEQPAEPFAVPPFQEKAHRIPGRLACCRDVVQRQTFGDEPAQGVR